MKELFNYPILELGDYVLKVSTILQIIILILVSILLLFGTRKTIYKASRIDIAKKYSVYSLIKYLVLILSAIAALQILGFNLSLLLAGSAALLVGFGFGIQNLFSDFVSGIVILLDSSIKVNDVIEVNGLVCQVQEINLRTTTVLTRDDKYIILPNTDLTSNQVINWTHSEVVSRFEVSVGVDYSSDVSLVMKILKEAAENQKGVLTNPKAFVRFTDFAESSLNFSVIFWTEDVFRVETIKSEIRIKIFEMFAANNVTIPFPQRVVHFDKNAQKEKTDKLKDLPDVEI